MTNLWEETLEVLRDHGKTFEGVRYIQGSDFKITKENFERLAKQANYHSGFGAAHVPTDLTIVGKGWWLERGEYDGSEWWDFKETPKQINEVRNISCIVGGMWPKLKDLNTIDPIQERLEEMRKERGSNETRKN